VSQTAETYQGSLSSAFVNQHQPIYTLWPASDDFLDYMAELAGDLPPLPPAVVEPPVVNPEPVVEPVVGPATEAAPDNQVISCLSVICSFFACWCLVARSRTYFVFHFSTVLCLFAFRVSSVRC
jgi:hypothetical protein